MTRYAAFLRGVMPYNCKMPALKAAFEAAGFTDVKTLLGSGNVLFSAAEAPVARLQLKCEVAMAKHMGRTFLTIIRSVNDLRTLLAADPYKGKRLGAGAKRVVTFLREPPTAKFSLPVSFDGARIHVMKGSEVYSSYVPGATSPTFMTLIEKTLGKEQTTRTWQTVEKAAR